MTGEPSWTECATQVMEGKEQVWFTVQAIVSEIRQRNIKPSMHRLPSNEACRSLRSCLRHHARKENGRFMRRQDSSPLVQYALRKGVQQAKRPRMKQSSLSDIKEGQVEEAPVLPPSPTVPGSATVEVDDPSIHKPYRPRHPRDWTQPGFMLPSPSLSLLGPGRTLTLMSAQSETTGRPVRKTRGKPGRRARERGHVSPQETAAAADSNRPSPPPPPPLPSAAIAVPEELCALDSSHDCHVTFFKSSYDDGSSCAVTVAGVTGPAHVQGDRDSCVLCTVNPDLCVTSDLSSSSCDESETETCTEDEATPTEATATDSPPQVTVAPPTLPSSHYNKLPHSQPSPTADKPIAMPASIASRRSDLTRHLAHLFSSSSPLIGENLKVLLGSSSFERLSLAHRKQLLLLLPSVDFDPSGRIQPVALSNSFFGSACREWQDHLTLGLRGNTGGRRVDKKSQNHDDMSWKNQFYESTWGERVPETERQDQSMFFPCEPVGDEPLSLCLKAILSGYRSRLPPPSPPPLPPPPSQPAPVSEEKKNVVPRPKPASAELVKMRPAPRGQQSTTVKTATVRRASVAVNNRHLKPLSKKNVIRNHQVLSNKNEITSRAMFLSPLPHKMSYAALLSALQKASRHNHTTALRPSSPTPFTPTPHSHPVFLDHYSTLHASSVPEAFLSSPPSSSSPPPSTPLLLSLPRSLHTAVLAKRAVLSDHNYTPIPSHPSQPTLPLSLPRSLLTSSSSSPPPHTSCVCTSRRLTLCSTCNSLYHVNCSHGNLCPSCVVSRTPPVT